RRGVENPFDGAALARIPSEWLGFLGFRVVPSGPGAKSVPVQGRSTSAAQAAGVLLRLELKHVRGDAYRARDRARLGAPGPGCCNGFAVDFMTCPRCRDRMGLVKIANTPGRGCASARR